MEGTVLVLAQNLLISGATPADSQKTSTMRALAEFANAALELRKAIRVGGHQCLGELSIVLGARQVEVHGPWIVRRMHIIVSTDICQ